MDLTVTSAYSGQTVLTCAGDFCDRETQVDGPDGEEGPMLNGQRISGDDPDDPSDPDGGWELAIRRGCYAGSEPKAGIADVRIYTNPGLARRLP